MHQVFSNSTERVERTVPREKRECWTKDDWEGTVKDTQEYSLKGCWANCYINDVLSACACIPYLFVPGNESSFRVSADKAKRFRSYDPLTFNCHFTEDIPDKFMELVACELEHYECVAKLTSTNCEVSYCTRDT